MKFPSVKKAFGRIASVERISGKTVKVVGAALLAAGLVIANTPLSKADIGLPQGPAVRGSVVFVIPAAPSIGISDGTTQIAGHTSHVSHSSHVSHGSHCSGASYCG